MDSWTYIRGMLAAKHIPEQLVDVVSGTDGLVDHVECIKAEVL